MDEKEYDFTGWATRSNLLCDGMTVPLVWNHQHSESNNVLGKVLVKNIEGGVRVFAKFNDTESGENAKKLVKKIVKRGDITSGLKHYGHISDRVSYWRFILSARNDSGDTQLRNKNISQSSDDVTPHTPTVDGFTEESEQYE